MANCFWCDKSLFFDKIEIEGGCTICEKCYDKLNAKYIRPISVLKDETEIKRQTSIALETVNQEIVTPDKKKILQQWIELTAKRKLNGSITSEDLSKLESSRIESEEAKAERIKEHQEKMNNLIMTTGYEFEGYSIVKYGNIISDSVVLGTGFLSEFTASFSDLFGTASNQFGKKLETARHAALEKLRLQAVSIGCNAIIGIDFDYITFASNMIGVVANGTAVIVKQLGKQGSISEN